MKTDLFQEAVLMVKNNFHAFFLTIILVFLTGVAAQGRDVNGDYAGLERCTECHEEQYKTYRESYHGIKGDPRTPAADRACESCHGPGAGHAEEEDIEKILLLGPKSPTPAEEINATCLECHTKSKQSLWHGSTHEERDVSCTNCHSIHGGHTKNLAKRTQIGVCNQCHQDVKAELMRQSHHPIREGKIKCMDCHNPHGSIADKLIDAQYVNLKCFECHAETRGPFLWEHPPVVEDCITCHTPHGSSRSPLLRAKTPYLCQRCHANVAHPSTLYARRSNQAGQSVYVALNNRAFYRSCLNCHGSIHGSNHPSGKSLLR